MYNLSEAIYNNSYQGINDALREMLITYGDKHEVVYLLSEVFYSFLDEYLKSVERKMESES